MKPLPNHLARAVEVSLPAFVRAIERQSGEAIVLPLESFDGNIELFYHAVWYALDRGKEVRVVGVMKPTTS